MDWGGPQPETQLQEPMQKFRKGLREYEVSPIRELAEFNAIEPGFDTGDAV